MGLLCGFGFAPLLFAYVPHRQPRFRSDPRRHPVTHVPEGSGIPRGRRRFDGMHATIQQPSSPPLQLLLHAPHDSTTTQHAFLADPSPASTPQGQRSATAQGLGSVITTVKRMMYTDHRLYIHRGERTVNGILKVGRKKLFIRDSKSGKMHEIEPLCVLDFYVHESLQR